MMERHNRKSHLAPQLSPSTQSLLRGDNVVSPSKESSALKTPTSGEIPIAGDDMKPSPPSDTPAIQRSLPTDVNGSSVSAYSTPVSAYERPFFPPRTSSNPVVHSIRPRDSDSFNAASGLQQRSKDIENSISTTILPIRPAPPPSGPLPPPPSASLRTSASRRQVTNGLSYTSSEIQQY